MGCIEDNEKNSENYGGNNRSLNVYANRYNENTNTPKEEIDIPDLPELNNGKLIGEGIKQIPSYKCEMAYDKLNQMREKFWSSRTSNKRYWKVIRECCETDADTAVILLEAAEMACVEGDLRKVFALTNPDFIFKTPNFCICDPVFERDYDKLKDEFAEAEDKKIKVILYYLAKNKNVKISTTTKSTVRSLKEKFAEKSNIDLNTHKIRLLFKGQELIDDKLLCYNNITNESNEQ